MKPELKAKFLQHLNSKKSNQGFTLIELLVVIIIIGILAAIALPSFLNQANKAKLSEAKTTVRSASEAQKAFFVENNAFLADDNFTTFQGKGVVSSDIADGDGAWYEGLGLGLRGNLLTPNYNYVLAGATPADKTIQAQAISEGDTGDLTSAAHKAYMGGLTVAVGIVDQVYCEAIESPADGGNNADAETLYQTDGVFCPDSSWKSTKTT